MSVKIRLARIGRKNLPAYKIVVANTRDKRNGRSLDILGHYNPSMNPDSFSIDKDRYEEWINKGAQVTSAVKKLVEGKYEFEPYTRQNEKDGSETASPTPAEKNKEVAEKETEEQEQEGTPATEGPKAEAEVEPETPKDNLE
jgi:small subunit ribosomal protein S16